MMAETVVYSREFLFIKEMYEKGELGKIQYLAASHPQDMDGWPDYWEKMIPMHYATHVVSPCLGLVNGLRRVRVSCFGSGTVRDDIREEVGQQVRRRVVPHQDQGQRRRRPTSGGSCTTRPGSIARASTCTARRRVFEWTLVEDEPHVLHTAKKPEPEIASKVEVPDFAHLLPEADPPVHAAVESTTPSTCRSSKAAATAARIRTW